MRTLALAALVLAAVTAGCGGGSSSVAVHLTAQDGHYDVGRLDRYPRKHGDGLTRLQRDGAQPGVASVEAIEK